MKNDHPRPKISIIIPNLHSPMIDQTIESVLKQETDIPYEIIVVGMDKWNLVEQFSEVKFIQTPAPVGAAEARNIGIKDAQGEWLLFIDSDCIAQPGWINAFVDNFTKGHKVIGGGIRTPQEPLLVLIYNLSMLHGNLVSDKKREVQFLPTLNLAVHREVIDKIGLMDEALLRGQDVDWTARMTLAGYKLLFDPMAAIEHHPKRQGLKTLREYNRRSGYYMIRVRHRYPEIFHMPKLLKLPIIWRVFSPLIAGATTLKILINSREVRKHIKTLPYIYLLKLSWCKGAAESLGQSEYDQAIA
jgi:GT2 family glycosyltransferase